MIKNIKKFLKTKVGIILLSCLLVFLSARVYYRLTDDFRMSNISYDIPHRKDWEVSALSSENSNELIRILDQKFTYLGKGAQSYVFTSEDNKYVIKFFKFKHLKPSFYINALPSVFPFANYKNSVVARKARKLESVFVGYHIAFTVHKEEAGLIYIHLNKTDNLKKSVTVLDKIGRSFEIDLDTHVFILQKKGKTLQTTLTKLLQKEKLDVAKTRIRQIFDLYVSEYKKGIYDFDHGVMHNTGFIGDQPIHLDVGKFLKKESMKKTSRYTKDLEIIYKKIDLWVQKHYPKHHAEIARDMKEKYLESTL